jgi:DNA-binding FadR family transcriptional regulator
MAGKYWEDEEPITAETSANVLKLYPAAGKLQVARPMWKDKDGKTCNGKMVVLDLVAAGESADARALMRKVLETITK